MTAVQQFYVCFLGIELRGLGHILRGHDTWRNPWVKKCLLCLQHPFDEQTGLPTEFTTLAEPVDLFLIFDFGSRHLLLVLLVSLCSIHPACDAIFVNQPLKSLLPT